MMCTDGCAQEYSAFIQNMGKGATFPNAVHCLCYFHLAIIGFNTHVTIPSQKQTTKAATSALEIVRMWVKTWFFDVEREEEYQHSKSTFLVWLDESKKNGVLPAYTVDSIKVWITNSLQTTESMWLNHRRLYVCTMNVRSTSIAEAMHWSMKSSHDGIRSGMSPHVSANTMMDKVSRLNHERSLLNADQVVRRQKWSKMPTANKLTTYCQTVADEQWDLRAEYAVVHVSPVEWWVFRPDNTPSERKFPPRYLRLRKVKLVDACYLWCSCGLPSRTKYPCRHIYAVTHEVHEQMFGLRWHVNFQYHYGRRGSEQWTEVFDSMLAEEFARKHTAGQVIFVKGMSFLTTNNKLPWIPLHEDEQELVVQANLLHRLQWDGDVAVVRGEPLPLSADGAVQHHCYTVPHSLEAQIPQHIHDLQKGQANAVKVHGIHESFEAGIVDMARTCVNIAGTDEKAREYLAKHLHEAQLWLTRHSAERQAVNGHVHFPITGKSNLKKEKRKKSSGI
jgi:hypothetical protein